MVVVVQWAARLWCSLCGGGGSVSEEAGARITLTIISVQSSLWLFSSVVFVYMYDPRRC